MRDESEAHAVPPWFLTVYCRWSTRFNRCNGRTRWGLLLRFAGSSHRYGM